MLSVSSSLFSKIPGLSVDPKVCFGERQLKDKFISGRIPQELKDRLLKRAEMDDVSASKVINRALRGFLNSNTENAKNQEY